MIEAFCHRFFRWSRIAKFMRLRISQFAATIPVVGYLLLWSGKIQSFLALHPSLLQEQVLSTVTRLKFVYAGSIFLALAWLIYQIRCHDAIKRYPNEEDYVREQLVLQDQIEYPSIRATLEGYIDHPDKAVSPTMRSTAPALVAKQIHPINISEALANAGYPTGRSTIYRVYYVGQEQRHPISLVACLVFVGFGLSLIAVPSMEVFYLVMKKFFIPFE